MPPARTPPARVALKGSRRPLPVPARLPVRAPGGWIEVTVKLRSRPLDAAGRLRLSTLYASPPDTRHYLTRAEHRALFGVRPRDWARLDAFAARFGLEVRSRDPVIRTVRLRGRVGAVQRAFGVRLRTLRAGGRRCHAHREEVRLPRDVAPMVRAVLGLDTRPVARPHAAGTGDSTGTGFSVQEVCQRYGFPAGLDGTGQCLALIEVNTTNTLGVLATGYLDTDTAQAFQGLDRPAPMVEAVVTADGAGNFPGTSRPADAEAALDVQVAALAAPGARIAVYFGLNTPEGYHDAMAAAVHDAARSPRVISTSWGLAEDEYAPTFLSEMDQLFREAATLGITVCASTGDWGSSGRDQAAADGHPHPHFPATSPSVLACGGTSLLATGGPAPTEAPWNGGYAAGASGGGISEAFPRPAWQAAAGVPFSGGKKFAGRGIPDLAAHADQANGYRIVVRGEAQLLGGTSAAAPLVAGLLTRLNQARASAGKPPLGHINPMLYAHPEAFRDLASGDNDIDGSLGLYAARTGWDPCTGLGAPIGPVLVSLLS